MLSRSRNAGLLCKIIVAQEQRPGVAVEITAFPTGVSTAIIWENKQANKKIFFWNLSKNTSFFFFHILEHNPTYRIHIFANFSDMSIANFSDANC